MPGDPTEPVALHGFAHGGEAVGRLGDGRIVFVGHAIPGETVTVALQQERGRWTRGRLVEVLEASPDRVEPPCPYFAPDRCGGCALQHIAPPRRLQLLRQVVSDQLQRLGGVEDPAVTATEAAGEYGYRSRARFGVDLQGRLGFRRANSNALIPIDRCLLLDETAQEVREAAGDGWRGVAEVEVRAASDGTAVVVHPGRRGKLPTLPPNDLPVAVVTAGGGSKAVRGQPTLVETVGGFRFKVSPTSFFQSNRKGAEILLRLVREAAAVRDGEDALDLYAGVGLFARGLAADGAAVTAIEGHAASAADARTNLHDLADAVHAPVSDAVAALQEAGRIIDVAVLDPPRKGAGTPVVTALAQIIRRTIVYVSCDPAALARDARTLGELGWRLERAVPVDQFAQTASLEVVATFQRV